MQSVPLYGCIWNLKSSNLKSSNVTLPNPDLTDSLPVGVGRVPHAERDVSCGRDVCFANDVRFARECGTHHITATNGSNITMPQGIASLAPQA